MKIKKQNLKDCYNKTKNNQDKRGNLRETFNKKLF